MTRSYPDARPDTRPDTCADARLDARPDAHPTRRCTLQQALVLASRPAWPLAARAQSTKIVFGYTAVVDFATIFIAKEEGYVSKRNLDVEPKSSR